MSLSLSAEHGVAFEAELELTRELEWPACVVKDKRRSGVAGGAADQRRLWMIITPHGARPVYSGGVSASDANHSIASIRDGSIVPRSNGSATNS